MGALLVSAVDNLVRPRLMGTRLHLHPLATFFCLFGGLAVMGPLGLLVGPLAGALATAGLEIYRADFLPRLRGAAAQGPSNEARGLHRPPRRLDRGARLPLQAHARNARLRLRRHPRRCAAVRRPRPRPARGGAGLGRGQEGPAAATGGEGAGRRGRAAARPVRGVPVRRGGAGAEGEPGPGPGGGGEGGPQPAALRGPLGQGVFQGVRRRHPGPGR
ncbi:MAG: AI-2E family transporter [Deltaproteobacteria bacterium]|nr:AI-2E family transporter [Deltaproteobacteria bacterium]